jgi:hypothetical protein
MATRIYLHLYPIERRKDNWSLTFNLGVQKLVEKFGVWNIPAPWSCRVCRPRGTERSGLLLRSQGRVLGSVGLTPVSVTPLPKTYRRITLSYQIPFWLHGLADNVSKQFKKWTILILLISEVWSLRRRCQMNDHVYFSVCSCLFFLKCVHS